MKDLIKKALDLAVVQLEKVTPQIKKKKNSIDILDVNPIELTKFMQEKNIPNDAYFDGRDNGYDAWDAILLSWDTDIPTTDLDKLKYKRQTFSTIAFGYVFDLLTKNGYKRVGYDTGFLKEFDNTTVYDMYINSQFDRLVKYYSLPFVETK